MRYATLAALLLAALVSSSPAGADPAVVIGAVYPTGGGQGPGGIEEFQGVSLAAEYVNQQGGWHGRLLRLELAPANSWDAAPFAIERLHRAGIAVAVGSYGSTIFRPAAETAARLGMVFWETGAVGELTMSAAPGKSAFRFAPSGSSLGRAAVAFVRDQLAPRLKDRRALRYAVTYVDDVYGQAVGLGAIAEIRESGLPLAAVLPYDLRHVRYDALARRIAQARTDVLVVASYLQDAVALRRALLHSKVPLITSIGTSSSYCMPIFGELLGKDAVGLFASDKPDGDVVRLDRLAPAAAQALRWATAEYRRSYGGAMSAATLAGFAGGLALFRYVLPLVQQLSAEEIARAARAVRLPEGALPNGAGLAFGAPGHSDAGANLRATSVIWEWVQPRTRAVVWPSAFATHPIVFP